MIREVDLVSYLPEFMQTYEEPVAALEAENPEFDIVWKAVDRVLYNRFISTADEYGISRFEKMLNINPSVEDTLESRRVRVQARWFNTVPHTWKALLQKLTMICNDSAFTLSGHFTEGYTLTLITNLELFGQVDELEHLLETMLPCNIHVQLLNQLLYSAIDEVYTTGGIVCVEEITIDSSQVISTNGFVEITSRE